MIAVNYMCVKGKVANGTGKAKPCPGREMGKVDGYRGEAPTCPICETVMGEVPGIGIKKWKWNDTGFDKL